MRLNNVSRCHSVLLIALTTAVFADGSAESADAQGLLGKRFVSAGYTGGQLSFNTSDWYSVLTLGSNLPLNETWDLNAQLSYEWYGYTHVNGTQSTDINLDAGVFNFAVTKHFLPNHKIDPFVSYGVTQAKLTVERVGTINDRFTINDTVTFWRTGAEIRLSDRFAVIPSFRANATLDEILDVTDFYFNTDAVYWWNERWLGGVSVGSGFDDNEIAVGGFLGFSY